MSFDALRCRSVFQTGPRFQQRYHHGKPSEATIYAGMIGIGCTIGLRRMMRISRGVTEAELEHTVNWHFSLDGLQVAKFQQRYVKSHTVFLLLPQLSALNHSLVADIAFS